MKNVPMHSFQILEISYSWFQSSFLFFGTLYLRRFIFSYIQVFMMAPQILVDNLRHSFFVLKKISLLIFDECHHARGRRPYACIMTVSLFIAQFLISKKHNINIRYIIPIYPMIVYSICFWVSYI